MKASLIDIYLICSKGGNIKWYEIPVEMAGYFDKQPWIQLPISPIHNENTPIYVS